MSFKDKYPEKYITAAYFKATSIESPNAWVGHLPFAAWIIQQVKPKVFVELGTHTGNSYFSFCQTVENHNLPTSCYAVDTWAGDEHSGQYSDEVFYRVDHHNRESYARFSKLMRMTFDDALSYFADASIELLHIDGLHTYEAVKHDFESWLPKLAPGAVVLFHDTQVRERNFGVWKLWQELKEQYPLNLEFLHSHGLGVLQLNNAEEHQKVDCLEWSSKAQQSLVRYFATLGDQHMLIFDHKEIGCALAHRDGQLATLNQAVADRDGQLATLNQAVADRDGELATLNLAVADRDVQLATLNQAVEERNAQIYDLEQKISNLRERVDNLGRIVESAKHWQKRSWAKRAFHRWREPNGSREKISIIQKLKKSYGGRFSRPISTLNEMGKSEPTRILSKKTHKRQNNQGSTKLLRKLFIVKKYYPILHPRNDLKIESNSWISIGKDPQFELQGMGPVGKFNILSFDIEVDRQVKLQIYWSKDQTYSENKSYSHQIIESGNHHIDLILKVSSATKHIRFDPAETECHFTISNFVIKSGLMIFFEVICQKYTSKLNVLKHKIQCNLSHYRRSISISRPKLNHTDIIVPIFNGFDVLQSCVASLIKNSPRDCNIFLINDLSTDKRIKSYLEKIADLKDPRISIINNSKNLGFTGTVNRGLCNTSGNVILLNSDTEVPPRWVERMVDAWRSSPNTIGTVTAMSNNATICSFPEFCQDNEIPHGYTALEIDQAFSEIPIYKVNLPTAVGFCMFISRACIEEVGLFDEKSFGKGYGEENDYCVRAMRKGFSSIAATNLFVYHKGSVSFDMQSKPLMAKNYAILTRKWPAYEESVKQFIDQDPLSIIRIKTSISLLASRLNSKRPVVMMLSTSNLGGGTEKHINELSQELNKKISVLKVYIHDKSVNIYTENDLQPFRLSLNDAKIINFINEIKNRFQLNCIHLHHIIYRSDVWLSAIKNSGIRYFLTLHDLYVACPTINLINNHGVYCGAEKRLKSCQKCINNHFHPVARKVEIKEWRKKWANFLNSATCVFAPSNSIAQIISKYYPDATIKIVPHGARVLESNFDFYTHKHDSSKIITVACIGAISKIKGLDLIEAVADRAAKENYPFRIVVIGYTENNNNAVSLHNNRLIVTGRYESTELPRLLNNYNAEIALLPSICPETYSYALSEAWQNYLPVLGSPLGAIGERIADTGAGWVLSGLDVDSVCNKLLELAEKRDKIQLARKRIKNLPNRSIAQMANDYHELFTHQRL